MHFSVGGFVLIALVLRLFGGNLTRQRRAPLLILFSELRA
jgi:hypothetical protein